MLASEIISELGKQLNDVDQITWTEASLIEYIDSAQQQISSIRPDAFSLVTTMQMAAGSRQQIPATGRRLLDIKRNMGTDGLTPGRAVHPMEEEAIDLFAFDWQTTTQEQEVKNFHYNEKIPDFFYVDPPSDGTGYIELYLSVVPTLVTDPGDTLDASDIYRNAVIQWCMFRAYSIEVDSASSQQRAQVHFQNFHDIMGQKYLREVQFSPSEEVAVGG